MIKKWNLKRIIFFIALMLGLMLTYVSASFAAGPGEYTRKNIAIVGDSYIEFFKYYVSADDFEYYQFPSDKGITSDENVQTFMGCIEYGNNNYILFCAGVNDFLNKTDPATFENYLRFYIQLITAKNKYLFFHTYMSFYRSELREDEHTVKELDDVYRKLAEEFPNVYYIDMSNLDNDDYAFGDGYNYDESFFVTLGSKMVYLTESIEATRNTTELPWFQTTDKSKMAVAGDTFASSFVEFEKDRFNLLDFSSKGTRIEESAMSYIGAMNSDAKYVLISIGVEDFENKTELINFEKTLRMYINLACLRHKIIYLHSYMHFLGERPVGKPKVEEYDAVIEKLAKEYPNTTYIDMKEYATPEYQGFTKYYTKSFYDKLFEMIKL